MNSIAIEPEIDCLKAQMKATWMSGDYDLFSRYMEQDARVFYEQLDVAAGCQLLDVACGSGQVALLASRDGVNATGVDIATNLVERAQARADAEGLKATFIEGDAEELPFENDSFDVVTSLFGAMFAPRPELVAQELVRVCSPGGTIAMGNWTPQGFVGQMFKTIGKYVTPPDVPPPVLWGNDSVVCERLGRGVVNLRMTRRQYRFSYPFAPVDVVEFFRQYYGPMKRAFSSLNEEDALNLRLDLERLWAGHNRADGDFTVVTSEYLEVLAIRA